MKGALPQDPEHEPGSIDAPSRGLVVLSTVFVVAVGLGVGWLVLDSGALSGIEQEARAAWKKLASEHVAIAAPAVTPDDPSLLGAAQPAGPDALTAPGAIDLPDDDPFLQAQRLAATPDGFIDMNDPAALQRKGPPRPMDPKKQAEQAAYEREVHERVKKQIESTELSAARRAVRITMYSATWCGVCTKARRHMEAEKIPFTEHDIDEDPTARTEAYKLNPKRSVPTITIDDELMVGFGAASLEKHIVTAAKKRVNRTR